MKNPIDTAKLLAWFKKKGKSYPWGATPTPYMVWISEIMLQQTVITTVIPYFRRWMKNYPDIFSLAAAKEEDILRLWEGLGYYSRARNIYKAAKIIVAFYGGDIPAEARLLEKLPGIGPYTTNAILSIAFAQRRPVIDANILRIAQRLLAQPAVTTELKREIGTLLKEAMPPGQPGRFNEAMMQLGQLVCRPVPLCSACPLREGCRAYATEQQESIPKVKKKVITDKQTTVLIFRHKQSYFLTTNKTGLFKGLWRFPGREKHKIGGNLQKVLKDATQVTELKTRNHFYTHYRDQLNPLLYDFNHKPGSLPWEGRWAEGQELSTLPFPSVYRKIAGEAKNIPVG